MVDLILYDVTWRKRFVYVIRACVYIVIISLVLLGFAVNLEQNKKYTTGIYNEYISVYGEVGHNEIKALKKELTKVPDWLLEEFVNEECRILVSSTPLRDIKERYYGQNDYKNQTIGLHAVRNGTVEIWVYGSPQAIEAATLHEFGHYLDRISSYSSKTDAFLQIYEQEKYNFIEVCEGEYYISSASEYFAECFRWYLNNPRSLKKNCLQTLYYLDNLISLLQMFL